MSGYRCPLHGQCAKPCPSEVACKRVADSAQAASVPVGEELVICDAKEEVAIFDFRYGHVTLATTTPVTFQMIEGLAASGALLGIPKNAQIRGLQLRQGGRDWEVSIDWATPS
jgi:hypothetical protein